MRPESRELPFFAISTWGEQLSSNLSLLAETHLGESGRAARLGAERVVDGRHCAVSRRRVRGGPLHPCHLIFALRQEAFEFDPGNVALKPCREPLQHFDRDSLLGEAGHCGADIVVARALDRGGEEAVVGVAEDHEGLLGGGKLPVGIDATQRLARDVDTVV